MSDKMLSVIIPAYNEAERIGETLQAIRQVLAERGHEIIVIDDGSDDETSLIAYNNGADVLTLDRNMGKGQAVNKGVARASGDIFLLLDADLGRSVMVIEPLLKPIFADEADLSIAHFPRVNRRGGFGLVKGLAHYGLYYCTGNRYYSPISGQRAIKREAWDVIGELTPGWGMEVQMTVQAHFHGCRIVEVPVQLSHRETQRDLAGFMHRGAQFRDILVTLTKLYWKYRLQKGGSN